MKAEIHPTYYPDAKVTCASCGTTWTTGSTKKEIRVDICSNCHPFFTGEASAHPRHRRSGGPLLQETFCPPDLCRAAEGQGRAAGFARAPHRRTGAYDARDRCPEKAGIENFGQFLERLNGGNEAVLAISGFGQASLTAAKKKLRSLGYEVPAAAAYRLQNNNLR